jgi:hypothetical protein
VDETPPPVVETDSNDTASHRALVQTDTATETPPAEADSNDTTPARPAESETADPPTQPTSWFAAEFTKAHAKTVTGFDALKAQIAVDSAALHADMDARWAALIDKLSGGVQ